MHNSYFHHVASCLCSRAKPLTYAQWLRIVNAIEAAACTSKGA